MFNPGQGRAGSGRKRETSHFGQGRVGQDRAGKSHCGQVVSLLLDLSRLCRLAPGELRRAGGLAIVCILVHWHSQSLYPFAIASVITQRFLTLARTHARTIQTSCASLASPSPVFVFLHHSLLLCLRLLLLRRVGVTAL